MTLNKRLIIESFGIFCIGLFIFCIGLSQHSEFIQFESRTALFAQEMLRGKWHFFPTVYGLPYPDYPGAQTWLIVKSAQLFGELTVFSAAFPSAVAAALTLSLIYTMTAKLSRDFGIMSVLITLMTYGFVADARALSLDIFVTLATTWAFLIAYQHPIECRRTWLQLGLVLSMGFLFRGPIGVVIPSGVLVAFYIGEHRFQNLKSLIYFCGALLIFWLMILFTAAFAEGGLRFMHEVWIMQVGGRLSGVNAIPFFYLLNGLAEYAIALPIAFLVILSRLPRLTHTQGDDMLRLVRGCALWIVLVLLGMSIPGARKIRYILPIVPAAAICAAYAFVSPSHSKVLVYIRYVLVSISLALPYIAILSVIAACIVIHIHPISAHLPFFIIVPILLLTILGSYAWRRYAQGKPYYAKGSLIFGVIAFLTVYIGITEPIRGALDQTLPFVQLVEAKRLSTQSIAFYNIGPDAEDVKYMLALNESTPPEFVHGWAGLLGFSHPAIFIAKTTDFDQLPESIQNQAEILAKGLIGHRATIAFTFTSPWPTLEDATRAAKITS